MRGIGIVARAWIVVGVFVVLAGGAVAQEEGAWVTFEDQASDGGSVLVEAVFMEDGGFVVIHNQKLYTGPVEESVQGVSAYLEPGTHEEVRVVLDPPIEEDQLLIAMPHRDTDGNERFEYFETNREEDGAYQGEEGAVVDEAFVRVPPQEAVVGPGPLSLGLAWSVASVLVGATRRGQASSMAS